MSDGDDNGRNVSARTPKPGQFQKGKSGNPRGRPKKVTPAPFPFLPARHPTREILRREAARQITVTDATGRHDVSTTAAVLRALALGALRGGVLAQRTYLEYQQREDDRYHGERKERFEFWQTYQERQRAHIAAALKAGGPVPEIIPHPDDIVLDYHSLDVTFLGAMDEDGRAREKKTEAFQELAFEMSHYLDEGHQPGRKDDDDYQLGAFMLLHISARITLPPRLRQFPTDEDCDAIRERASRGKKAWGDDLERRCREAGIPFIRWRRNLRMRTISHTRLQKQWANALAKAGLARP